MTIPFSIISFLAINSVVDSKFINKLNISQIGRFSYTIYLLHMPIAGVINILCENIFILNILKFLFVIEIMKMMINMIFYASDKVKRLKYLIKLIGLPLSKNLIKGEEK